MTATPFSYRTYDGTGSQPLFSVPFPYLEKAHVKVFVDGVSQADGTEYDWNGDTEIRFQNASVPANGTKVLVKRETPEADQIVIWQNGSYIIAEDLNESDLQWLYLIQEHEDAIEDIEGILGTAKAVITTAQATADPTNPAWNDDEYLASAGAIDRVYSQLFGDGSSYPGAGNQGKQGKIRIDNTGATPKLFYWDASPNSWVEIQVAGTPGAQGPEGPVGPVGPAPGLQNPPGIAYNVNNKPNGALGDAQVSISQISGGDLKFTFGIPVGIKGDRGLTGQDGQNGQNGQNGAPGTAATISVGNTTTGAPGSDAEVTNTGSSSAAVFNFKVPRGDQGQQGPPGPAGSGVNYLGSIDPTTDPEPADPDNGDLYISSAAGSSSWAGLTTVQKGTRIVWNEGDNKWDSYDAVTQVDLGWTPAPNKGTVTNNQGTEAELTLVTSTNAGLMAPAQQQKLAGIDAGAQVNPNLDNYLQKGDEVSDLLNDANYISDGENISKLNNNVGYLAAGDDVSDLNNDAGYITDAGVTRLLAGDNITLSPSNGLGDVTITASGGGGGEGTVKSVNSKNPDAGGNVTLTASDVGALPNTTSLDFVPLGSWASIPALT